LNVQQSLVLGLIQGLTEFIPVSSTAHLILAPQLLSISEPRPEIAHTFDTCIQLGTVLPVLIYFRSDWASLLMGLFRVLKQRKVTQDPFERLAILLLLGSLPAGILGLAFEKKIEYLARPGEFPAAYLVIGISLILVGLLMVWSDRAGEKGRPLETVRTSDALLVGLAQAAALIPGVSRSGATMTAGLFAGLTREAAARFSFLLMTPIMLAATGYKGLKLALQGPGALTSGEWSGMLLATVVAAVSGYGAIAFLLGWLRTRSLGAFALYRLLLGSFAIAYYFYQK